MTILSRPIRRSTSGASSSMPDGTACSICARRGPPMSTRAGTRNRFRLRCTGSAAVASRASSASTSSSVRCTGARCSAARASRSHPVDRPRWNARDLRVASPVRPATAPADLTDGIAATFLAPDGASVRLDDSAAKAALEILAEHWPASVGIELTAPRRAQARWPPRPAYAARTDTSSLDSSPRAMQWDTSISTPGSRSMATAVSDRPVASALARIEIERGDRSHQPAPPPSGDRRSNRRRRAIARLDGTRDLAAILEDSGPGVACRSGRRLQVTSRRRYRGWRTTACWKAERVAPPLKRCSCSRA